MEEQKNNVTNRDTIEASAGAEKEKEKQKGIDRIVSERLKRERAKWEKELQEQVVLAQEQSAEIERQKAEALVKSREEALLAREGDIFKRELRAEAAELLGKYGLPPALINCVNLQDGDTMRLTAEALRDAFYRAVDDGVNQRLVSKPPKTATGKSRDLFLEGLKSIQ